MATGTPHPRTAARPPVHVSQRALAALHEIAVEAATGGGDAATVARLASGHACSLLEVEAAAVFAHDEESGRLVPLFETPSTHREPSMATGEGMVGQVFSTLTPLVVEDYLEFPGGLASSRARGMRGAMAVPLVVAGRPIGVMGVWSYEPRRFSPHEVNLLTTFAAQVAPAVEAARLRERRDRHAVALEVFHELATTAAGVHDSQAIAELAVTRACELTGGDTASLLVTSEDDVLRLVAEHRSLGPWSVRPGEGIAGTAFAERRPVVVPDYRAWPKAPGFGIEHGVRSAVAVPLLVRNRAIGALVVLYLEQHEATPEQVQLLSVLAAQVAPDLDIARLLEESHQQLAGMARLQELAVSAAGMLDPEALAHLTVDRATGLVGVDCAVIRWLDESTGRLGLLATNDTRSDHEEYVDPGNGIGGRAFAEGRLVISTNYPEMDGALPSAVRAGVVGAMAVPLVVGSGTVGSLAVANYHRSRFTAHQARLLALLASQVAPALEAARLSQAGERQRERLHALRELGASSSGLLEAGAIARLAMDLAARLLEADSAAIAWREVPGGDLVHVADQLPAGKRRTAPPDAGIAGEVLRTGEPVVVEDYAAWPGALDWSLETGVRTIAAVPLRAGDAVEGLLLARWNQPRHVPPADVETLALVAAQVAPALDAARLHASLAASAERLRSVYAAMSCAVVLIGAEGHIVDSNRAARQLLGDHPEKLHLVDEAGMPLAGDSHPIVKVLQTGRSIEHAIFGFDPPAGERRWVQVDAVPMFDAEGNVEVVVASAIDITEVQRAEAERRENEAKSRFLANMSHELRTPLNSVLGFAQLLEAEAYGELNDRQRRYVSNIASSGRHLLQLVNDVLDLSKVAAGQMTLHPESVAVMDSVGEVVSRLRPMAEARGLAVSTAGDARRLVRADRLRLEQVLFNLVSNAFKFTPEGGSVEIRVRPHRTEVRVEVHDTGIGIPPEDQERVFQEFTQVDSGPRRRHEGTGLGLPLSRRLVELMGGRLWVESEPGTGSTFAFSLPRA